jgi:hypothetical protein
VADERITTRELSDDEIEDRLVASLRLCKGQGFEADLVVASGLAPHQVGPGLRRLLAEYRSHVAVTSDGMLLYRFDPRFVRRSARPGVVLRTAGLVAWGVFVVAFKAMAGLVLLGYVGIFALLMIVVLAGSRIFELGSPALEAAAKPNRLRRAFEFVSTEVREKVALAREVFAFVFGPATEAADELADERDLLAFVRARQGVISPSEIIAQTGWSADVADQESTRLVARYGGDVEIEDGRAVFTFPDLMTNAGAAPVSPCPPPCWERIEKPVEVTGNEKSTDDFIVMLNLWVLVASTILLPFVIAPHLDLPLESPDLRMWLIYVPALYALGSFLIHFLRRRWVITPENRRRLERNLRRLILREAFAGRNPYPQAARLASELAPFPVSVTPHAVEQVALAVALELRADTTSSDVGPVEIRWNDLASNLAAASSRRARVPRSAASEVVFSSEETLPPG